MRTDTPGEEEKINIRDIHQTFWKCRDFELANLWQRSIFLTAFLVLCFTAYGTIVSKLVDSITKVDHSYLVLNIIGYILSILGIILSIMWIKMGKGSKAWYEAYESAINAIEIDEKYAKREILKIGGFQYNTLDGYKGIEIDNGLFSGKAGEYSVSKLNIGIGQLFLVFWVLAGLTHTFLTALKLSGNKNLGSTDIVVFVLGIIILTAVVLFLGRVKSFKSGAIKLFE